MRPFLGRLLDTHGKVGRHPTPLTNYTVEDRGYKTPCHIWNGKLSSQGYARVTINYVSYLVHRLIWMRHHGPIPSSVHVHHRCEQRACIRLGHLEALTPSDHQRLHKAPFRPRNPYGDHDDYEDRFAAAMKETRE